MGRSQHAIQARRVFRRFRQAGEGYRYSGRGVPLSERRNGTAKRPLRIISVARIELRGRNLRKADRRLAVACRRSAIGWQHGSGAGNLRLIGCYVYRLNFDFERNRRHRLRLSVVSRRIRRGIRSCAWYSRGCDGWRRRRNVALRGAIFCRKDFILRIERRRFLVVR